MIPNTTFDNVSDAHPQWHNYDQGLLNWLGQDASGKESERFLDTLGSELGVDLFAISPGFKVVHTPFTFLEAIGITSFPNAVKWISDAVMHDFEAILPGIEAGSKSITELPMIVMKHYQCHFLDKNEVAVPALVSRAETQMKNMPNPIVAELLRDIIQHPADDLNNPASSQKYHSLICDYLSVEFTQKFPYYDFLSKSFPEELRKTKTQEIYHAFFQMAEDAVKQQLNLSYFRSFDRARNTFSLQAGGEQRKMKQSFADPYRVVRAYLENNKDYLDSYLVHFAICGFFFEGQCHKTFSFTLDTPAVIRNRLAYGLQMLHWINECKKRSFQLNLGAVYCFDKKTLTMVDKIEVDKIEFTPIPIGRYSNGVVA